MSDSDEEFISEEEAESPAAALKKLREKLNACIKEKQEYLDGWQRSRADFVNYKREEAALHEHKEARIKADLVEEFLATLDTLELALKHEDNKTLRMLEKQFLDALKRVGVEKFGKKGEAFDPHLHEALAMHGDDHIIKSVERSGYKIGNMVIRPAQVII